MTSVEAEALARATVRQIGPSVRSIREIVGQGAVNHVFVVDTSEGTWVVRFHLDPLDTDDYAGEEWCLRTMKDNGVSVPGFIRRGTCEGVAFIVQTYVEGVLADRRRSPELWRTLGRYARIINDIPLDAGAPDSLFPRFGRDLVLNWQKHVAYNLVQLTQDDPLIALGAYQLTDQDKFRRIFETLAPKVNRFGLTHGDLVPKNVLLPPEGPPVLIDWGSAGTGAVPYNDYQRIWADEAHEGFTSRDMADFAEGYGVPLSKLEETMKDLSLLHLIDVVRWAIDNRPDRIADYAKRASAGVRQRLKST